jgi:hypothetical protein
LKLPELLAPTQTKLLRGHATDARHEEMAQLVQQHRERKVDEIDEEHVRGLLFELSPMFELLPTV